METDFQCLPINKLANVSHMHTGWSEGTCAEISCHHYCHHLSAHDGLSQYPWVY